MLQLSALIHLLATAWIAYLAPWLFSLGIAAYLPSLTLDARSAVFVALALGAAFLGGTILGRSVVWHSRRLLLAALACAIAIAGTAKAWLADASAVVVGVDLVTSAVALAGPGLWALGMMAGLYVGGRYMRSSKAEAEPPSTSLERRHDE